MQGWSEKIWENQESKRFNFLFMFHNSSKILIVDIVQIHDLSTKLHFST